MSVVLRKGKLMTTPESMMPLAVKLIQLTQFYRGNKKIIYPIVFPQFPQTKQNMWNPQRIWTCNPLERERETKQYILYTGQVSKHWNCFNTCCPFQLSVPMWRVLQSSTTAHIWIYEVYHHCTEVNFQPVINWFSSV